MAMREAKRKRRKGLLPQTKALRYLADHGLIADMAERKMGLISKDWGGFADIVAVDPLLGVVSFIQVTSCSNFASRRRKILESDVARRVVRCNKDYIRVIVWGYDSKLETYEPQRTQQIYSEDFD